MNIADAAAPPQPAVEERVSTVVADRLCVGCGFNLYGQPVLREPRYRMFIVRCPECAKIAALEEYPALGKWATRWAVLLAALWFLLSVAWLFGSAGAIFGLSFGATEAGTEPMADAIVTAYRDWQASQGPVQGQQYYWRGQDLGKDWWKTQDARSFYEASGGLVGAAIAGSLPIWLAAWLALAPLGVFASALFLHARRLRVALMALLPPALAACGVVLWWIEIQRELVNRLNAESIAHAFLGPGLMAISFANCFLALAFGLVLGRPILRSLIRLLLPPRRRFALSGLWLCDGLQPPTAARRSAAPVSRA